MTWKFQNKKRRKISPPALQLKAFVTNRTGIPTRRYSSLGSLSYVTMIVAGSLQASAPPALRVTASFIPLPFHLSAVKNGARKKN